MVRETNIINKNGHKDAKIWVSWVENIGGVLSSSPKSWETILGVRHGEAKKSNVNHLCSKKNSQPGIKTAGEMNAGWGDTRGQVCSRPVRGR